MDMLIGAHVSPAGGPANAIQRGLDLGCRAIQIFNQSPRMWKPSVYKDDQIAKYQEAFEASEIDALLIHAIYLLNPASEEKEFQDKTLASLTQSLRSGEALGAAGVVLHPGSAKTGDVKAAIKRAGKVIRQALDESDGCELHLENTAGTGGTLGRSMDELAALYEAIGDDSRLGLCLDSCHLYASGFDVTSPEILTQTIDEAEAKIGKGCVKSLHFNDSQTPLGANRDRHANVGEGELGQHGAAVFLSEPRFDGLPCVLETPGVHRSGPTKEEIALCHELRGRGLKKRA